MDKHPLGEMLIQEKVITPAQLEKAMAEQKASGKRLGHALIDLGYIKEDDLLKVLGKQLDTPTVNLNEVIIETEAGASKTDCIYFEAVFSYFESISILLSSILISDSSVSVESSNI